MTVGAVILNRVGWPGKPHGGGDFEQKLEQRKKGDL